MAARLAELHEGLSAVLARYRPEEAAIEETFVNADPRAALKLGQARGVALLVPAQAGLPVAEYAPNLVKKSIVGAGRGEKGQVRMMVKVLLPKANPATEDAADALAVAITHAHHRAAPILGSRRGDSEMAEKVDWEKTRTNRWSKAPAPPEWDSAIAADLNGGTNTPRNKHGDRCSSLGRPRDFDQENNIIGNC